MIEKGRILIVEDSPALGHLYGVFLEAAGYEVVHVMDGAAGEAGITLNRGTYLPQSSTLTAGRGQNNS